MAASGHVAPASTRRDLAAHLTGNTALHSLQWSPDFSVFGFSSVTASCMMVCKFNPEKGLKILQNLIYK